MESGDGMQKFEEFRNEMQDRKFEEFRNEMQDRRNAKIQDADLPSFLSELGRAKENGVTVTQLMTEYINVCK